MLNNRINHELLHVLDWCAGLPLAHCVSRDLGFTIQEWHTVESDQEVSKVVEAAFPRLKSVGIDIVAFKVEGKYHAVIAGPPCQP